MAAPRWLVGALTLATLGLSLAACTDDDPEPGATPTATGSPSPTGSPAAEGPLEVAVSGTAAEVRAYERLVAAYQDQNPEAEVRLSTYQGADPAREPLLTAMDDGWDPDVFLADFDHLANLVSAGRLLPVDTLLEEQGLQFGDDYQRAALNAFSADARLQCMPAEMSPLVVYYNEELVDEELVGDVTVEDSEEPVELPTAENAGWTWEEFVAVATAVAERDGPGPLKGAWFPADVETLTAYVRSAGGDVVDDPVLPTSLNLTSDEALTALTALTTFARDGGLYPTPAQLEVRSALGRFLAGDLGFLVGTRADLPRLRAAQGLDFDVLPLPSLGRFQSVSTMEGWCVSAGSERVSEAADFIAFAVGESGFRTVAESGAVVPTGLTAINDEVFTQPVRQPANAHVYASSVRRSEPMPFSPAWGEVAQEVEAGLGSLYTDPEVDLEDGLAERMEELNERSVELFASPEEEAGTAGE